MIKYYKAWIIYFTFLAFINVLGVLSFPFVAEDNTFIYVTWQVVSLIGLLGLFGYIKQIKIGTPLLWGIFLAVDVSLFFGNAIYSHMEALESHGELGQAISIRIVFGVILPLTVLLFPYWYGIYIYAFKSKSLWK